MTGDVKRAAVYVPWMTFKNSLDQLAKGMPSRIDRSVFTGIAWNVQSQLFAAYKFLGLLKGEDEPTQTLDSLVQGSEEDRKAKLKAIIEARYAQLIDIDLTKASRAHFEQMMGEFYGITGDTKDKAVRFFISAAEYTGIPLSTFIAPVKGSGRPRRSLSKPRTPRRANYVADAPVPPSQTEQPLSPATPSGTSKTIQLKSGGTLTLSATFGLFELDLSDRTFVFELIDKLQSYNT